MITDDETLLRAVADGDRAALRALYERHAPWLTLRLARRCPDPDLVDDARAGHVRCGLALGRTLRRTGRGRRLDLGHRRAPADRRDPPPPAAASSPSHEPDADLAPSAEEQVLLDVAHGDLGGALNRLSPELRAVVQATVLDGLTTREAGQLLGIPAGTVKTRMMRARIQLREELA